LRKLNSVKIFLYIGVIKSDKVVGLRFTLQDF
jgi:hypothetical protein